MRVPPRSGKHGHMRLVLPFLVVPLVVIVSRAVERPASPHQATKECIAFVSANLAKGKGNYFTYLEFSTQRLTVKTGDVLAYDIFLSPKNPVAKGGIDVSFDDNGDALRDTGVTDQNGIRAHGDGLLKEAVGKWLARRISLEGVKGRIANGWSLNFEGDEPGVYAQFVGDIAVNHMDGSRTVIYESGALPTKNLLATEGYTRKPSCITIPRSQVSSDKAEELIAEVQKGADRIRQIDEARKDLALAKQFLERHPDQHLQRHVTEATALLDQVEQRQAATEEELQAAIHAAHQALSHTHPAMTAYTGHLVGHAHIDLQWLWEWQEGIVATHDTFNQAVRFMREFPGFTFSQSSSCLYKTTEQHYPELFKQMQDEVKKGHWEIVGGRICEGDTNMISPESHARHFLYGQRYFREKFGKTAVVGWEPDTFGHCLQMPQILKLGGCNYYYFCRGGKGKPLFWWKGLDGTKILTFDEPASGSWYNSDLSYKQFQEMLDFERNTGSKDMLWVYGVGNHGGGPTREYIQEALKWMKDPSKPVVKFSTASQFFKKLEGYDLSKIPQVSEELNPVFDGCYTTHSEIKQLNRNAEAWTTSAEAVAAVASQFGFRYPKASFRRNWEDICFNHHHDTLPGSGIHAPYENTKIMLGRVIADDKDIANRALELMSLRVTPERGGISVMVFNPLGWARSGWVQTLMVQSGWDGGERLDPEQCAAFAPDGKMSQVDVLDGPSHLGRFYAPDVPPFGYKVFQIKNFKRGEIAGVDESKDGRILENGFLRVEFDTAKGVITKVTDKRSGTSILGEMGRLENHFEAAAGMSAWVIGKLVHHESWVPSSFTVEHQGSTSSVKFRYMEASLGSSIPTTVAQTFSIHPWSTQVECEVDCDWEVIGSEKTENPMLRVAFETDLNDSISTHQIPFGAIERPTDDKEYPALQWADLSSRDGSHGLSVLNDCKHGHSATGSTMRLTLIRSSFSPDPVPNPGHHHWRYSVYPHNGDWRAAETVQRAAEFNQPLLSATVPFDAKGSEPLQWSPVSISGKGLVATVLKMSEDDRSLVLRFFESQGQAIIGGVTWATRPRATAWVNFVEDRLGSATLTGNANAVSMHPFEIRTLKAYLASKSTYQP